MDKRLFAFLFLSVMLFIGWVGLQTLLLPPAKKPPAVAHKEEEKAANPAEKAAADKAKPDADKGKPDIPPVVAKEDEAKKAAQVEEARKAAEVRALQPDKEITLGGVGYKLTAVFSERGGAVRTVTLNDYWTADRKYAKPVFNPDDKKAHEPLMLITDDGKPEQQSYRLLSGAAPIPWKIVGQPSAEEAVFEGVIPGKEVKVTRTFRLKPGRYHIDMELKFERVGDGKEEVVYELTGPHGLPLEGEVWRTLPYRQVVMATVDTRDRRSVTRMLFDPRPIKDKTVVPPVLEGAEVRDALQYAGVRLQYFAALTVVHADADKAPHNYIARADPEYVGDDPNFRVGHEGLQGNVSTRLTSRPLKLRGEAPTTHQYLLYAGPAKTLLLGYEKGIEDGLADRYTDDLHLSTLTDYTEYPNGPWQAMGWTSILVFFTNWMHRLLEIFYKFSGSYGVAIIMLTVCVRGIMFPISRRQALMSKRMQAMAPEMKKIKEEHKGDKQAQAQAQMELYRKHSISPLGGCLPILLQMPVFMGLYYSLNESVHLRLESFLWMSNLAAPDMLLFWGDNDFTRGIKIGPFLNLLPLFSITLMFFQQKLLAPPPADEQQAAQMKMMNYMMIFFGYMFYWVASGLCLYFIMSSLWGLLERKLLGKTAHLPSPPETEKPTTKAVRRAGDSRNGDAADNGKLAGLRGWWHRLLEEAKKK